MIIKFHGIFLLILGLFNILFFHSAANKLTPTRVVEEKSIFDKLKGLNPSELLDSKLPQPKVYMQATLELKRLCDQPICHRMAAHLLINNCKGLNEIDEQNYHLIRSQFQQDQVDAFAATLTICDMERAKFDVPKSCFHFSSVNIMKSAELRTNLNFSSREVNDCLQGLGKNAKHWATWLSYRDSALLFCRAARLSIERDESIALHRELMEIMREFTSDLYSDLEHLKENMRVHKSSINSFFNKINSEAKDWKSKFDEIFGDVSHNLNDARLEMKNIIQDSIKVRLKIREGFSLILKDSSQMAKNHWNEVKLTIIQQGQQLEQLEDSLSASKINAKNVQNSLLGMQTSMKELQKRQESIEEQTKYFHKIFINASILLHNHTQELERVSSVALGIHKNLEKASLSTLSLFESQISSLLWILSTAVFGSLMAFVIGNCSLKTTLVGNIVLIFSGDFSKIVKYCKWSTFPGERLLIILFDICGSIFKVENQTAITSPANTPQNTI